MEKSVKTVGAGSHRRRRRTALAGTGAAALLLAVASVAYACTLLIGTFTVCQPASSTSCAQRTGVSLQTGIVTFDDAGSNVSIQGDDFSATLPGGGTVYSLTFAVAGPNCHLFNTSAGVTSLLGTYDHDSNSATPQIPNTVSGPDFTVGVGAGSTGGYNTVTTPAAVPGVYSVCAQDEPQRVDGNAVSGLVML